MLTHNIEWVVRVASFSLFWFVTVTSIGEIARYIFSNEHYGKMKVNLFLLVPDKNRSNFEIWDFLVFYGSLNYLYE